MPANSERGREEEGPADAEPGFSACVEIGCSLLLEDGKITVQ